VRDGNPNSSPEATQALLKALVESVPRCDVVNLGPFERPGADFEMIRTAFKALGWATQDYFCFGNWYLPSESLRFSQYWSERGGRLRSTVMRKWQKFEAMQGARVEIITDPADVERGITAFQTVYQRSWKQPEPYPGFISGLARACAERGWLRLSIAWLEDRPIASQLWIVSHGIAYIYKLAHDREFSHLSAGSLLSARMFEHVLDIEHVREVDYLTGDDPYKEDWMTHRRERWGLLAFNPRSLHGMSAAVRHIWGRRAKQAILRRFPGQTDAGDALFGALRTR
jgi:hypothetical protein